MEKEYRKKEKMETIEVEEQDEPGENGVILEINMKDIENEEQSERVKAYSLVKVQKLVPKDNQSEISEEDQDEEMI